MRHRAWIICERSGCWSAALRTAIARAAWPVEQRPQLIEVRQLGELIARLDGRPEALALVEARQANLSEVLGWLTDAAQRYPRARFVALVDRELGASKEPGRGGRPAKGPWVVDVLREAGASDVVISPRNLEPIFALGLHRVHAMSVRQEAPPENVSIEAWAWASLPWQEE